MRPFRKKRRPGNKPMTAAESAHVDACKAGPCMPCLARHLQGKLPAHLIRVGVGYDHSKSGNIRRGHLFGFASCDWHHQRIPLQGVTFPDMLATYGPSLLDGSRTFRECYGTDDELIELQSESLEART